VSAGFNLRKASNPSYIRKYYDIYDPYLTSKIYAREVQGANYTQAEALYFQDMRSQKMFVKDLFAAPMIRTKRLYPLFDQSYLSIDSNQLFYKVGNQYQAWRSSNIFNLSKTLELQNHVLDVNLYNKIDLYKFNATIKDHSKAADQNATFVKNIPEIHISWRYPLITNNLLIIEPVALISSNLSKYHDKQILPIDSETEFELDELNLVSPNRFSGRDNNETGDRISYGVNLQKINQTTYSLFLGKNHSKLNKNHTVGNISTSNQISELYYRFNLSSKFNINMHELGTWYTIDKLDLSAILFKKNSIKYQDLYSLKKISNLTGKIRYNFNENWSANLDTVIDLSNNRETLIRGFGVTYQYDCVRISVRIFDNFTQDPNRNIKKSKNNISFKIGLKTLNM
jgi:lipopolysaccharide assembly outer membrane protein LptD (OstA)